MNVTLTLDDVALDHIVAIVTERVLQALDQRNDHWPEWMDIPTAAAYMACSPHRVRKLVATARLAHSQEKPGARIFIARTHIDHHMRTNENRPRPT